MFFNDSQEYVRGYQQEAGRKPNQLDSNNKRKRYASGVNYFLLIDAPDAFLHQIIVENGTARHSLLILPLLFSWLAGVRLFVASDIH